MSLASRLSYQPLRPAPPARASITIVPRLVSSAAIRLAVARMLDPLTVGLLPALDAFARHQKVPSSELNHRQPTHSRDGTVGCTTCSPTSPSAQIRPSDRCVHVSWGTEVLPTTRYYMLPGRLKSIPERPIRLKSQLDSDRPRPASLSRASTRASEGSSSNSVRTRSAYAATTSRAAARRPELAIASAKARSAASS